MGLNNVVIMFSFVWAAYMVKDVIGVLAFGQLPIDGIGLARFMFVIINAIVVHPKALLNDDSLDPATKAFDDQRIKGYGTPNES